MSSTYEPIATTTLGSAQASVTFSSISGAYTDLVIVANFANSNTVREAYLQFNSDGGNNYSKTQLFGSSSVIASNNQSNFSTFSGFGFIGTTISSVVCNINNYSNTTTNKTILSRSNDPTGLVMANVGLWRNTAAITTILIGYTNDNFIAGSTFTLYGIKAE
jgi:hypothetical protein